MIHGNRSSKCMHLLLRLFFFVEYKATESGLEMSVLRFSVCGYKKWTIGAKHEKFGIETGPNQNYSFLSIIILKPTNTSMATVRNFEVISRKFNVDRIFTYVISSSQKYDTTTTTTTTFKKGTYSPSRTFGIP